MTILFVTSGDAATNANLAVATGIIDQADVNLLGPNATRQALNQAISNNPANVLMIMSHGRAYAVMDTNGSTAITAEDAELLAGYRVFSWACHTGRTMGAAIAQEASTWWGYDCAITAPDEREKYLPVFVELFLRIKTEFPVGIDNESVISTLDSIKNACDQAANKISMAGGDDDEHAFSLHSCCRQAWQHLRVWLTDHAGSISHADAPPISVFGLDL